MLSHKMEESILGDPSQSVHNWDVKYDSRLWKLPTAKVTAKSSQLDKRPIFHVSKEDLEKVCTP